MYLLHDLAIDPALVWRSMNVHHSPLLLLAPRAWIFDPMQSSVVWAALDSCTAASLAATAAAVRAQTAGMQCMSPAAIAAVYALNPYAVAACVAKSMSTVRSLCIALAVWAAVRGTWWGFSGTYRRPLISAGRCALSEHAAVPEHGSTDACALYPRRRLLREVRQVARALRRAACGREGTALVVGLLTAEPLHDASGRLYCCVRCYRAGRLILACGRRDMAFHAQRVR